MTHHDKPSEHMPHAGDAAVPTAEAGEAVSHLGQDDADDARKGERRNETGGRPVTTPGSGGLASGLQPGGTSPGGGPGASVGSIGTGGGATGGAPSGSGKTSGI